MTSDESWMALAIKQAKKAEALGEVPVGAVLVKDDMLVAKGHNQPISLHDASAHAEIQLLRLAGRVMQNYRLPGTTLYVTLEPCAMCLGAMMHARVSRLVFAAFDPKTGVCGSSTDLSNEDCFNHQIEISGGVLEIESKKLLQDFFKSRRQQ
jgi:tRNA(adenine34) deaminase